MNPALDPQMARALLDWQIELGATEAIGDMPVNRYALAVTAPAGAPLAPVAPSPVSTPPVSTLPLALPEDPVAAAEALAARAADLDALRDAIAGFDGCELKKGARRMVFADGNPAARVMIVGEAPGREEDQQGLPFVGRAGQLLDRMLAAIGLSRASPDPAGSVYITNVVNWRPPQNRDPNAEELAMMLPFARRHIELADPDVLILMGNIACLALTGRRGITRLRGQWLTVGGRQALPMLHPAYLLRNPLAKREAWADLLALQERLRTP